MARLGPRDASRPTASNGGARHIPHSEAVAPRHRSIDYAVQSRRVEPLNSLDHFPTPPWATRALCEWIAARYPVAEQSVWEPAAGAGHMSRPLGELFGSVHSSDVHDYGVGAEIGDFLAASDRRADWIITNPPFRLADRFAHVAVARAEVGVALLVRTAFLEGSARHAALFSKTPPSDVLQFVERVPMHKGRLVKGGSTATAYAWLVWRKDHVGPPALGWIAPCRKRLERDSDYLEGAA